MNNIDIRGKRVLIREDLNVPVRDGRIVNDTRLRAALPTIRAGLAAGAKLMLMSHLGRPEEGLPISEQPEFSLAPIAAELSSLLGQAVQLMAPDFSPQQAAALASGSCVLLENVRANVGEKADSEELARYYASLCDIF